DQQRDHADEQELAHEAEVALAGGRYRPHGEEDHAGAHRGVADQLHAVAHRQREVQDRPEPPAEQSRHEEQQGDADAAIAVGRDADLQADHRREHHQRADDRIRENDAARRHADEGADYRRHHGQREKQISVAQYFLALLGQRDVLRRVVVDATPYRLLVGPYGLQFHLNPPSYAPRLP